MPAVKRAFITQEHGIPAAQRCSVSPRESLRWCSAPASSLSPHATPARTSWDGHRQYRNLPALPGVQDFSPVESNERLLLTLGRVLSKCFVRYNPVSISTYIKWKRFTVTKPIVFYLSNVYFRWYHQKAFFFPLCENTFNQFLFLEEKGEKCFLKSKESASHPSSCASAEIRALRVPYY